MAVHLSACGSASGVAQRSSGSRAPTRLIWSVLSYRQSFLAGSIPVDPCSVRAVMERPGAFKDSIGTPFGTLFEQLAPTCAAGSNRSLATRTPLRTIRFDSVAIADSTAKAYLTVIDGENGSSLFVACVGRLHARAPDANRHADGGGARASASPVSMGLHRVRLPCGASASRRAQACRRPLLTLESSP